MNQTKQITEAAFVFFDCEKPLALRSLYKVAAQLLGQHLGVGRVNRFYGSDPSVAYAYDFIAIRAVKAVKKRGIYNDKVNRCSEVFLFHITDNARKRPVQLFHIALTICGIKVDHALGVEHSSGRHIGKQVVIVPG